MLSVKKLVNKNYYATLTVLGVFYHVIFVRTEVGGIWDKILLLITASAAIIFFIVIKVLGFNKDTEVRFTDIVTYIKSAVYLTISLALIDFFILLIIFQKNPPVAVGIPYSIYSFTMNRFLPGLAYNIVFYFLLAYILKIFSWTKRKIT